MALRKVYTVNVSGNDHSEISKLPLEPNALETALVWPLCTMFRAPYDRATLRINIQGQVISADMDWHKPASQWESHRTTYYQYNLEKRQQLLPVWGLWAAFNTDGSITVYNSFLAAKTGATGELWAVSS